MNARLMTSIWTASSCSSWNHTEAEKQYYRDHLEEWLDSRPDISDNTPYWMRSWKREVALHVSQCQQPFNPWWVEKEQLYISAMDRRWTEVTQDGSLRTRTTQNTATVRFRVAVPENHFQQRDDFIKQANQPQTSAPYQYGAAAQGANPAKRQKL